MSPKYFPITKALLLFFSELLLLLLLVVVVVVESLTCILSYTIHLKKIHYIVNDIGCQCHSLVLGYKQHFTF